MAQSNDTPDTHIETHFGFAAACPRCGGWTTFGGMSQYAECTSPKVCEERQDKLAKQARLGRRNDWMRCLRAALQLEATDRRHLSPYVAPGCSAFSIIKKETGIKARSARELLPLFDDWIKVELRWESTWLRSPW